MTKNISSEKIISELDNVIQNYIDTEKKQNRKPTRDKIIEVVTDRLQELLRTTSENSEKALIIYGIALGIAMALQIEVKLEENE